MSTLFYCVDVVGDPDQLRAGRAARKTKKFKTPINVPALSCEFIEPLPGDTNTVLER